MHANHRLGRLENPLTVPLIEKQPDVQVQVRLTAEIVGRHHVLLSRIVLRSGRFGLDVEPHDTYQHTEEARPDGG
jgi:hypothetical protein